jgi:4-alpha-glucanotransferase
MGLTRLWLIPDGAEPSDGAYLSYPLTDMLRLLALESQRHRAIVVGEDLGTVPEGFRETLEAAGLHGMRVLWFERMDRGLWRAFVDVGAAQGGEPPPENTPPVVDAALVFTASTGSPLILPPIEDVLGIEEQPNLPGTIDEHPNWRRRLAPEARALLDEPPAASRIATLAQKRPRL